MKLFSLFLILFLFTIPLLSQTTINIPADYPTIQQGIDAAMDGDIVLVADGTYYENINFNGKGITVGSHFLIDNDKSHIENTIIDGSMPSHPDSGSVVMFNSLEDSTSILCGFTITKGTGTKYGTFREGGGIRIDQSSPTIRSNIIEFNEVIGDDDVIGSAISAFTKYGANLIIEENIIRDNYIQTTGSSSTSASTIHIASVTQGTAKLRYNYIYSNVVTGDYNLFGGGILVYGNNLQDFSCYIENNLIVGNEVVDSPGSSTQWGGGIYLEVANAIVRNNIIAFNSAEDGGGIYYYNNVTPAPVTPLLENNTIFGNTATVSAGALNTNREFDIINCIVWGNSSPQFFGGGATIEYSNTEQPYSGTGNISVDPEFLNTDTLSYFLLSDTSPCIDLGNPDPMYNDIEDPSNPGFALYPAQGTLINDIGHFGGPHSNWANLIPTTLNVPDDFATIQEAINAAVDGNTILVADGTYYENINYKGKAITVASHFLVDGDLTHIENTIIDGSQAANPDSGSVVYFTSGEDTNSVLCGFTITGGSGTYYQPYDDMTGGGIYIFQAGACIHNNIIEDNSLNYATYVHGGGILADVDSFNLIIESNVIRNNSLVSNTSGSGGGISIYSEGYRRIKNNTIKENTVTCNAQAWGGGINCSGVSNDALIVSNYIINNVVNSSTHGGGGISVYNGTIDIKNNLIVGNSAFGGGGVLLDYVTADLSKSGGEQSLRGHKQKTNQGTEQLVHKSTQLETLFENNTIIYNSATVGGGIRSEGYTPELMNCIVWGNTATSHSQISGSVNVQYSDVEGLFPGTGNIDADPQFDPNSAYYLMQSSSLCIDAGHSDPMYNDVEDPNNNGYPWAPAQGTLRNDMGHCGGPASLWPHWDWPMPVNEDASVLSDYVLFQNYPNPFNPATTIKYTIPERAIVELKVYDILGNEVAVLINEEQNVGYYELNFNASNLSSGVYFYQLKAGMYVETRKMLLLK